MLIFITSDVPFYTPCEFGVPCEPVSEGTTDKVLEDPAAAPSRTGRRSRIRMRRLQAAAGLATCASGMLTMSARASEATLPEELRRFPSDPAPPSATEAQELVKEWTSQEASPGYFPPDNSWPWPPESGNPRAAIPALRKALGACGPASEPECHEVAFRLATALLGGLDGHVEVDDVDERQRSEGANLMRTLAESGSVDGACGWGYCLAQGEVVAEDPAGAEQYYRQAARAGCEQAMHQLGVMHYLGDGTTTTEADASGEAVR